MAKRLGLLVAAIALVAAACGGDDGGADETDAPTTTVASTEAPTTTAAPTSEAPTTTAAATTTEAPAPAASVAVASSGLGDILVDGNGNTLYLFAPDEQGPSVCNDGCAAAWPPLVGEVTAGDGVDGSLLGTATRDDGAEQVTYNGWPLYYYADDSTPGDTNGQGVNDVWYVVDAAGNGIGI